MPKPQKGSFAKAEAILSEAITKGSTTWRIFRLRGECAFSLNKLKEADGDFAESMALLSVASTALRRAEVAVMMNEIEVAMVHLDHALELDASYKDALVLKGQLLMRSRPRQSVECFDTVLLADPTDLANRFERARAYFYAREFRHGLTLFQSIIYTENTLFRKCANALILVDLNQYSPGGNGLLSQQRLR